MGEACRRGTLEERKKAAIKRNKAKLIEELGGVDEEMNAKLKAGITPFITKMTPDEWQIRRDQIILSLNGNVSDDHKLETRQPIRVREDEIAWYLFLCEQAIEDPFCNDVSQVARAAPFFFAIGERWKYAEKVDGIEDKILESLGKYRKDPDGIIFEILVALSYAEMGWNVEFLKERPPEKSPDMIVRKDDKEYYIECKRQQRISQYSEKERNEFLRLWDAAHHVLLMNKQWIWLKGYFHVEISTLPTDFLEKLFINVFPIPEGEHIIYDGNEVTLYSRAIDQDAVKKHLDAHQVKNPSYQLSVLLGDDWAPPNSNVTTKFIGKTSHYIDCEAPLLNTYITDISWACGFTRYFNSEVSIDKKARDVTKQLSNAVKQVPADKPSIIHIAAETLDGKDVEIQRTEKVMASIPKFITEKPVVAVRFHRFQSTQTTDQLFLFDETVSKFHIDGIDLSDIPESVVVPTNIEKKRGEHWNLYD